MAGVAEPSFAELVGRKAAEQPGKVAFRYQSRGFWHDVTWVACAKRMSAVAAGLYKRGVRPGDCVVVAAPASPAWLFGILGAHALGALPLSLYQALPPADLAAIFEEQQVKAAIAEVGWLEMLLERSVSLPATVVLTDSQRPAGWAGGEVVMITDLEEPTGEVPESGIDGASPVFLFATAGTSGKVKVVAHSSDSLRAAARAIAEPATGLKLGTGDTAVVELPTGHVGALLTAIVLPQTHGLIGHLAEGAAAAAVREVHPTLSLKLAGGWERTAARVQVAASGTRGLKGLLFRWAQRTRRPEVGQAAVEQSPSGPLAHLAYAAIFLPLLSKLGLERIKAAYVVGVSSPDELSLWRAWGVKLIQAYGLTEAGPVAARQEGQALVAADGIELKLGPGAEVLIRGESVCAGYRKEGKVRPLAGHDGWSKTGDLGAPVDGGLLVLGERSDIIEGQAGPTPLALVDAVLRYSPYIRAAISTPRGQELEAYVDCDFASLARWASANRVTYRSPASLLEGESVARLFKDEQDLANRRLQRRSLPTIASITVAASRLADEVVTPVGSVRRAAARKEGRRMEKADLPTAAEPGRA